jgi:predicted ArsR family transcriptional regulator
VAVDTAYDKDGTYLGKLADVFGDPTRRGIYRHLRGASEPLSASEVAGELAFALGRDFGAETAAEIAGDDVQPPIKLAPRAVLAWMDEAGYSVTLDDGARGVVAVEVRNCVYRELAEEYPDIVCPFDRGTVCGMLGVDASAHTQTHSISAGDDYCRHEFRL